MIVADTNLISYFYFPTTYSDIASELYEKDMVWVAPQLWKSEFRNVLALYLRKELITFEQALEIQAQAELLLSNHDYDVASSSVLELIRQSQCSAYDCEFVALAKQLNVKLVTQDKKVLREFPNIAVSIKDCLLKY